MKLLVHMLYILNTPIYKVFTALFMHTALFMLILSTVTNGLFRVI